MKYYCQARLDEHPSCLTWDDCHHRGICLATPKALLPHSTPCDSTSGAEHSPADAPASSERKAFDERFAAFVADAEANAPKAVMAALHMLYGCYLEGKQSDFAKHCCQFCPLDMKRTDVIEGKKEPPCLPN